MNTSSEAVIFIHIFKEDDTMATAKKLPSGAYRCLIYIGDENGKRKYKSFTAKTKKEAEFKATQFALNHKDDTDISNIKFKDAMKNYNSLKESILSPYSITSYITIKNCLEKDFAWFCDMPISEIKQKDVQKVINEMSKKLSPKTVRSRHGYIASVLSENGYDKTLKTQLPQKKRPDNHVPTEDEVKMVLKAAEGQELEVPIMLAAFGMMRRGEICALTLDDFNGNVVHINKNMVRAHDGTFHIKQPKTYSGDRFVELPQFVVDKIKEKGYVTNYLPDTITKNFEILLERNNIQRFRFHDLRHFSASVRHTLVPDAYTMKAGGWSSEAILQSIYRHTLSDVEKEMSDKVNNHFSELMQHEMQHEKKEPRKL